MPLASFKGIPAAVDLRAEAAHAGQPQGTVELGRIVVSLPFVVSEAGQVPASDFVEDVGFGLAHRVVPAGTVGML